MNASPIKCKLLYYLVPIPNRSFSLLKLQPKKLTVLMVYMYNFKNDFDVNFGSHKQVTLERS